MDMYTFTSSDMGRYVAPAYFPEVSRSHAEHAEASQRGQGRHCSKILSLKYDLGVPGRVVSDRREAPERIDGWSEA